MWSWFWSHVKDYGDDFENDCDDGFEDDFEEDEESKNTNGAPSFLSNTHKGLQSTSVLATATRGPLNETVMPRTFLPGPRKLPSPSSRRSNALQSLVELDFCAFVLFDLTPLNEYELYICNYGHNRIGQVQLNSLRSPSLRWTWCHFSLAVLLQASCQVLWMRFTQGHPDNQWSRSANRTVVDGDEIKLDWRSRWYKSGDVGWFKFISPSSGTVHSSLPQHRATKISCWVWRCCGFTLHHSEAIKYGKSTVSRFLIWVHEFSTMRIHQNHFLFQAHLRLI